MPNNRFTKKEATNAAEAANEMFCAIPKSKQMDFLGHLNDILLFIDDAKNAAPEE